MVVSIRSTFTPGGVARDEHHRVAGVPVGVGVGETHEDEDLAVRVADAGGEPLATVDDDLVAVDDCAVAAMLVASEEATSGSVMQKALRISARSSGSSHCSFCASVPYFSSTSMLPVSGALELKTRGARNEPPIASATGA